jgi:Subtilase family
MQRSPGAIALAVVGTSALVFALTPAASALASAAAPERAAGSPATALRLTATQAASLSADATTPVIVFLKDQPAAVSPASPRSAARSDAIAASQAPFLRELAAVHATHVKAYSLVNGFAATVSAGEESLLAADPAVARVIPDGTIEGPPPTVAPEPVEAATAGEAAKPVEAATTATPNASPAPLPGACLPDGGVQLEPEGLALTDTDSQTAGAKTARSLGFTGAGVTVGFMADGIDTDNANFLRPGGASVFTHYADFSSDGVDAATGGGEAFLDANAIAGQGTVVYNTQGFSADSAAAACNIRIEGVAPGVNLVGLKVFGQNNATTVSGFLQAIDYAVETAKVNVLNQSFGDNPYPDTTQDAVKEFDNAAVAAGVTITTSTGDAGPTNTIDSPASDPNVISVGASTDFRFYAQTGYAGADTFATKGWLNDNISAFSSSGYSQTGTTIDLVAPGDLSFASCDDNPAEYADCTNLVNHGSDLEISGGTSQAAPEVAGAAALVIQAYRSAHHGATPSPALIKRILLSTAADLGADAVSQGAGLLDSYKAVEMALSIDQGTASGETVATSANQLGYVGPAGVRKTWTVSVTNTGAATQTIHLAGRGYAPKVIATGRVTLSDAKSPHFADASGLENNYGELHFTVAKGTDQLNTAIAYPGGNAFEATNLILIDPQGRYAASSEPMGVSNYGIADVLHPAAGTWTAVIFSPTSANEGTIGKVTFEASASNYVAFGSVSPTTVTLAPGASAAVSVTATTPATGGDASGAVVLNAGSGATTIPVTLRSLVNVARGGAFSGTLTGDNGRPPGEGSVDYYQFQVPAGRADLSANVTLANDPAVTVVGYLVAPDGESVGFGSNNYSLSGSDSVNDRGLSVYAVKPAAGTWTLILEFTSPVAGNEITDRYAGAIRFQTIPVSARGLPDSATRKLTPGKAVTVPVTIKNNGASAEDFFVDPRLDGTTTYALPGIFTVLRLPLPIVASQEWTVPAQTTSLRVTAKGSVPVMFDYQPAADNPDLVSTSSGDTAVGALKASPITPGQWNAYPSEIAADGYPAKGAKAGTVAMAITAVTQTFNRAITSGVGDCWLNAISSSATTCGYFVIRPGQTRVIDVTIRPSGRAGTVVRGDLYVDDAIATAVVESGSEIAALPYAYTIG